MTLLALLISTDDSACEVLGRVLPASGIAMERFSDLATAVDRLRQQRFDSLIIDFEDARAAAEVFEEAQKLNSGVAPVTVALLAERAKVREVLSSGAHFVLYKPLSEEKAKAGLRAVSALLNRERRCSYRVPVQAPVELTLPDKRTMEGILLDLSETGMDVLTAEPQVPAALLKFRFALPDASLEIHAHGQVAWAKPNGQTGVHFLDLDESVKTQLQEWLHSAASALRAGEDETVPHCKLTDLSLGGCYVETDSPFPERALVDLCLRTDEMAVHTEGMVRVAHPGYGMGVEFPSRTSEQRAQVGNLISFLRGCPQSMLEMSVSPRALVADENQFEPAPDAARATPEGEELQDPLLELLRQATSMHEDDFLEELRRQRSGEAVTT
ncbi:MAG: PilZ domain-containing protein [Candidatus Sulfotelmatobacter sp.]